MSKRIQDAAKELDALVDGQNREAEIGATLTALVKALSDPAALIKAGGFTADIAKGDCGECGKAECECNAPMGKSAGAEAGTSGTLKVSGKDKDVTTGGAGEEPDPDDTHQGGDEAARDALKRSEQPFEPMTVEMFEKMIDGRLAKSQAEVLAAMDERINALTAIVDRLGTSVMSVLGPIVKAQARVIKSLDAMPAKLPQPGVVGRVRGETVDVEGEAARERAAIRKSDVYIALTQAMRAGDVEPDLVGQFSNRGLEVLKSIPEHIRNKHGLPAPDQV